MLYRIIDRMTHAVEEECHDDNCYCDGDVIHCLDGDENMCHCDNGIAHCEDEHHHDYDCSHAETISIAGSSTVQPISEAWAESYGGMCPRVTLTVEGGGSSNGARRVCDTGTHGSAVEIGNMSRQWKDSEGYSENGWLYYCFQGNFDRHVIQVPVSIDAVSVIVKGTEDDNSAYGCIKHLEDAGGLTTEQLGSIFNGSITNWSDLDEHCPDGEIIITGPSDVHGTHEYFSETVFSDGESFSSSYKAYDEMDDIEAEVEENPYAIGYFGYAYITDDVVPIAIKNSDGDFVAPSPEAVADGTYNPFARRIYMNFLESVLDVTAPYLIFGLSDDGSDLVSKAGYVPIPDEDKIDMLYRIIDRMTHAVEEECHDDNCHCDGDVVHCLEGDENMCHCDDGVAHCEDEHHEEDHEDHEDNCYCDGDVIHCLDGDENMC